MFRGDRILLAALALFGGMRKVLDELAHLLSQEEVVQGGELRKMLGKTPAETSPVPQAS